MLLYVHRNYMDREPWTAISSFTQTLISARRSKKKIYVMFPEKMKSLRFKTREKMGLTEWSAAAQTEKIRSGNSANQETSLPENAQSD